MINEYKVTVSTDIIPACNIELIGKMKMNKIKSMEYNSLYNMYAVQNYDDTTTYTDEQGFRTYNCKKALDDIYSYCDSHHSSGDNYDGTDMDEVAKQFELLRDFIRS